MRQSKPITREEALSRTATLCSQCEQCTPDLLAKMLKWGLSQRDATMVIRELQRLQFVDDKRFARAYAHDKLRFSGWGRRKIQAGLWGKRLPREIIDEGIEALEDEEYFDIAKRVTRSKIRAMKTWPLEYEDKIKVLRHVMQRGFEGNIASKALREVTKQILEEIDEENSREI